jgi:hypothetical protein
MSDSQPAVLIVTIAKFAIGHLVATPNALAHIRDEEIKTALVRHSTCDWGDLDKEDWNANERALREGGRLFSQYYSKDRIKFWIITEADRSSTCVLLPEDY